MRGWSIFLIFLMCASTSYARGPGWSMSMPTFLDNGDNRIPFKVTVGTTAATRLPFSTDVLKDRAVLVMNPSAKFELMIGTASNFPALDLYWTVPPGSGTFSSSNHQTFWMKYADGASSETVRGVLEKQ